MPQLSGVCVTPSQCGVTHGMLVQDKRGVRERGKLV